MTPKEEAIRTCRLWLEQKPLFIQTETTGNTELAEVVEIAIVDTMGNLVFHSLVKPHRGSIPLDAVCMHGITNEMVKDAPNFQQIALSLREAMSCWPIIGYDSRHDFRILQQSADAFRNPPIIFPRPHRIYCAKDIYALFRGERDESAESYRWQPLHDALKQCGLLVNPYINRAHAGADACRRLVMHMAISNWEEAGQ